MVEYKVDSSRFVYGAAERVYPFDLPSTFRFSVPIQEACGLEWVDLFFGTYAEALQGQLIVDFQHDETHSRFIIDMQDIVDNAPLRFTFETQPLASRGVVVTLKCDELQGKAMALWMNKRGPSAIVMGKVHKSYALQTTPLISIITPVYKPTLEHFKYTAASVFEQVYENWQWVIVDDGSNDEALSSYIMQEVLHGPYADKVKYIAQRRNDGISHACNKGLTEAKGKYLCVLDHDDKLHTEALLEVAKSIGEHPHAKVFYTDEDKIDNLEQHSSAFYKPDWSLYMFLSQMYTCHLSVFKTDLAKQVRFRSIMDGAQDYDFMLRYISQVTDDQIVHIPRVLYHWRMHDGSMSSNVDSKPDAHLSALSAIRDFLEDQYPEARALTGPYPGTYNVYFPLKKTPKLAIIIPSRDNCTMLDSCISSIVESSYSDYNIRVVDNGSSEQKTLNYIKDLQFLYRERFDGDVQVLKYPHPFNFSDINNFAVHQIGQSYEYYLFLNDDVEAVSENWLQEMLQVAMHPDVGVVGAKLLYPDRRIQHAGVIIGIGGVAGHSHKYVPDGYPGYFSRPHIMQNVSAVTGACMMVSRKAFEAVGGFEKALPKAFNDVDFCLKVRQRGYQIVYNPRAVLVHHESASRGKDNHTDPQFAEAIEYMENKWHCSTYADPFYNPNLTLTREDFSYRY